MDPKLKMMAWQAVWTHRLSIVFRWARLYVVCAVIGVLIYDIVRGGYFSAETAHPRGLINVAAVILLALPLPRWFREARA